MSSGWGDNGEPREMQHHTPQVGFNKSRIGLIAVVATILAGYLILLTKPAIIYAALDIPPLSRDAVQKQFSRQMTDFLHQNRQVHSGSVEVDVEEIDYSARNDTLRIRYTLEWAGKAGDKTYTGSRGTVCTLTGNGNAYRGSCEAGENFEALAKRRPYLKVDILVR
jgi:hypothetical protein